MALTRWKGGVEFNRRLELIGNEKEKRGGIEKSGDGLSMINSTGAYFAVVACGYEG